MNANKLLAILKEKNENQAQLANAIGLSRVRLNAKIHCRGNASFTQPEISAIKQHYSLTSEQISDIFFADFVS